ncbi:hypothetical protein P10159_1670 [Citrobacter portucalensis]|nr:hypothetical protein P10159_1670 [Citrobacter portucalensis]
MGMIHLFSVLKLLFLFNYQLNLSNSIICRLINNIFLIFSKMKYS